jgi:fatty acid desaturase
MERLIAGRSDGVIALEHNDHSGSFGELRPHIRNSLGISLFDFVRSLEANYRLARHDIAWGHAALMLSLAGAAMAEFAGAPKLAVAGAGMVLIGYWIAYLQLFLHEGAHWNLAPDREVSDRVCNLSVGWLAGIDVKRYRKVHFQHHRALGTTADSEHSYFFPLNLVFLAKGLLGVRVMEVMLARRQAEACLDGQSGRHVEAAEAEPWLDRQLVVGAATHFGIIAILAAIGLWATAAAWLFGVAVMFPLFGALRQLLEHRDENASAMVDYRTTDHGAFTRIFSEGPIANTFGGAGFNRHLLHHWEPTVSYTRLKDLELFLSDTPLRAIIERRKTTYARTFASLFRKASNSPG